MQGICCLIHLSLFWAGIMSAVVLVPQKQVVNVSVGGSVTLKCSMEGGTMSNYYMNWYRTTQDNTMTFIYREGNIYGPGFQSRFRGSVDSSNNQAVLEILEASVRDEGSYYCASAPCCNSTSEWLKNHQDLCRTAVPRDHAFLLHKYFQKWGSGKVVVPAFLLGSITLGLAVHINGAQTGNP